MREAVYGYKRGEDDGCFESALRIVREFGGVIEHPAWSRAWTNFGLPIPHGTGWSRCFFGREWVCEVAQSAYGHRATKMTWLFYVGDNPPAPLIWKRPRGTGVISGANFNRGVKTPRPSSQRLWPAEASATPPQFAEALLALARGAQ
jgi:hypothetical protein